MRPLIGYAGALLVGGALYLVIAGLARHTSPNSLAILRSEAGLDARAQRLSRPLVVRLAAPGVTRLAQVGRRITPGSRTVALRQRLDAAGYLVPVETFYAAKTVLMSAGALLGVLIVALRGDLFGPLLLVGPAIGIGIGYLIPELVLFNGAQRRQKEISRELPEALDLLALTVQAGLGLEQGIAEVAGEVTGPLGQELDRVLKEQQLGRSRRDALESLQHRNSSEDLTRLTAALLHAERLGTPVVQTLQVQARELRRRRRASARERAGKAPVKLLFPLVFGIFPAMFVVIIGPGALKIMQALF